MWYPNLVIGHPFKNAEALDLYVSMGVAVPLWAFEHKHLPPAKPDGITALNCLCDHAATTATQWGTYDPDHPDVHRQARRKYLRARRRIDAIQAKTLAPKTNPEDAISEILSPPDGIYPDRLNLVDLSAS